MTRRRAVGIAIATATLIAVFVSSFALAPRSCEGGLEIYFWCGVAAIVVLIELAFIVPAGASFGGSLGWAMAVATVVAAIWTAGVFAANFRIICRLF